MENEIAIFGGGCFWCVEAIIQRVKGVEKVESGYAGGKVPGKPTYREVCSGLTGHAEVVRVIFNPSILSYSDLISIFMTSHDPTQLNQQGADKGTQYRSVIFYNNQEQKLAAEKVINNLQEHYSNSIVTELTLAPEFFLAEEYHQDYYNSNSDARYCQVVIDPKISKLRMMYADKLKE